MKMSARSLQPGLHAWYARHKQWLWRVILWSAFAATFRYVLTNPFYKDNEFVENWVAGLLTVQTVTLYYFFGYYVFPRHLYTLTISGLLVTISWLAAWHVVMYESNYFMLRHLQQINDGPRIDRDWAMLQKAGMLGFANSGLTAIWSFFYSFPFALMLLGYLAVKDLFRYRTKNLRLEREKLSLELDFLRSQINPHSLFNILNSVYADVFETNEKAADLVLRLSELMRYNLYEADVVKISLYKELAYIQNYLDLEGNRLSGQDVSINFARDGQSEQYQIAPLLLIAFVENAFKHGTKGKLLAAYVEVYASVENGQFIFQVENSVPARRAEPVNKAIPAIKLGGVGLGNVRRRLDALYKDRYELVITSTEESYTVVLTIQLEPVDQR